MGLVAVSVSVPEEAAADLLRYAATLCEGGVPTDDVDVEEGENGHRAPWGMGRARVRSAYQGGVSDYWRPFLEYLAERPNEWVAWSELHDAVGMTAREASGMLGAAERRCGGRLPYQKRWNQQVREFRMPQRVADIVAELAEAME